MGLLLAIGVAAVVVFAWRSVQVLVAPLSPRRQQQVDAVIPWAALAVIVAGILSAALPVYF